MKSFFKKAKEAANSWNQKELSQKISEREALFSAVVQKSNIEQWQVNVAVHYNEWENLGKNDFEPVVMASRELVNAFKCGKCEDFLRASPERESIDGLRCECGESNLNFRKK